VLILVIDKNGDEMAKGESTKLKRES